MKKLIFVAALVMFASQAYAHGGRTDKNGCHRDTKSGTRHCH